MFAAVLKQVTGYFDRRAPPATSPLRPGPRR
jgi:hypothetical protein